MARAARKFQELPETPAAAKRSAPVTGNAGHPAGESPAIDLQRRVAIAFESGAEERWSGRKTLLFTVGVCGGAWICIMLGVRALLA